jgi:hypothetical protein
VATTLQLRLNREQASTHAVATFRIVFTSNQQDFHDAGFFQQTASIEKFI